MASPVDTSVKFYREDFPGAPTLNGVAGSLIGLLEACLCTGFGLRSATSLVVSGGVATLTLASDAKNGNLLHSVILVEGSSITALNGEQRVTAVSSTELKFATAAADGTATGSITVKTAPAGWEKKFTGTNKAVFKSLAVEANTSYLQVSDTGALSAKVRAYQTMVDVDTGTGAAPTVASSASGGSWAKSDSANSTPNRWQFFSDSRAFYYCPVFASGSSASRIGQPSYFFGDFVAYQSADAWATALLAPSVESGLAITGSVFSVDQSGAVSCVMRSHLGVGDAVAVFAPPKCRVTNAYSGDDAAMGLFPAPTDGALRLARICVTTGAVDGASSILRGEYPGVYHVPQKGLNAFFQPRDTVSVGGKIFAAVCVDHSPNVTTGTGGRGFFDITGPWR